MGLTEEHVGDLSSHIITAYLDQTDWEITDWTTCGKGYQRYQYMTTSKYIASPSAIFTSPNGRYTVVEPNALSDDYGKALAAAVNTVAAYEGLDPLAVIDKMHKVAERVDAQIDTEKTTDRNSIRNNTGYDLDAVCKHINASNLPRQAKKRALDLCNTLINALDHDPDALMSDPRSDINVRRLTEALLASVV